MKKMIDFSDLVGKTLVSIEGGGINSYCIKFECSDGSKYEMYHEQDCCESVYIDDICGNLEDLLHSPILSAQKTTNHENQKGEDCWDDSWTWTFYLLSTVKADVTIKWYGVSNGYYSESVDFYKVK